MEKMTKQALISMVEDLNGLIREINYDNCYDKLIDFFNLVSKIDDLHAEIYELPLVGKRILGIKSRTRIQAEFDRNQFCFDISIARCLEGSNRSSRSGELANKHNVYFGFGGNRDYTIAELESMETALVHGRFYPEIVQVQPLVRQKIVDLVQIFKKQFSVDWLC